jgi:ATP sulfurylase
VNRELQGDALKSAIAHAKDLTKLTLDERELSDLEMIGVGALSPLTGFMRRMDYETVVERMRLSDGLIWAMPVTKAVTAAEAASLKEGQEITLVDESGEAMAIMQVTDIYSYDKKREAEKCFGTTEDKHPGVARLYAQGDMLIGGPVQVLRRPTYSLFNEYRLDADRDAQGDGRKRLEDRRRLPDPQPGAPRARVPPEGRAGNHRRTAAPPAGRGHQVRRRAG